MLNVQWMPFGEQLLPVRSALADPVKTMSWFFSFAIVCTGMATAVDPISNIAVTPESYHCRAMAEPVSGLFR